MYWHSITPSQGIFNQISDGIWMPLAFHTTWNLVQGYFGFNVSGGLEVKSVYRAIATSDKILSGGSFGIVASIITLTSLTVISISLFSYVSL